MSSTGVSDVHSHPAPPIDSRNAVSMRRIRNRRGEVMLEASLANADASTCVRCGEAIGSGAVYRLSLSTHNWQGRPLSVHCEKCIPAHIEGDVRKGWFTKQPCGACGRLVVLKARRGRLHVFCSPHCQWTYHNARVSNRTAADREKVCEGCGQSFTASRRDAKTCSAACKQKTYRQRKNGGAA